MSLSKVQKLEDNHRRDSFSDRVCDDLSEVILQFLPIKHKFYFECVSKQFQRTVYQRHYEFIVRRVRFEGVTYGLTIGLKTFETILKKLPNIKSLKCLCPLNNEWIEMIIKNCNHLNECNIDLSRNSTEIRKSFADRFGPQLTLISFLNIKCKLIINSLVNIQKINYYSLNNDFNDLINFYTQIKPKSLKKIRLYFEFFESNLQQFLDIQRQYFQTFIDNNKSITHLWLTFLGKINFIDNNFDLYLRYISQLNQLTSLQIQINIGNHTFPKSIISDLKEIAVNCLKLKSLSLRFNYLIEDLVENNIMTEIKKFKALKRLEFRFNAFSDESDETKNYFINSMNTGFQDLTHLTIDFNSGLFNENFLDNIDINLPKLQKLIIRHPIKMTERTADILSRLSKLETLELYIWRDRHFMVSLEKKILEKCPNIKSIKLRLFRTLLY